MLYVYPKYARQLRGGTMTIEEFEQKAEEINGKGEWFRVVYISLYK